MCPTDIIIFIFYFDTERDRSEKRIIDRKIAVRGTYSSQNPSNRGFAAIQPHPTRIARASCDCDFSFEIVFVGPSTFFFFFLYNRPINYTLSVSSARLRKSESHVLRNTLHADCIRVILIRGPRVGAIVRPTCGS